MDILTTKKWLLRAHTLLYAKYRAMGSVASVPLREDPQALTLQMKHLQRARAEDSPFLKWSPPK